MIANLALEYTGTVDTPTGKVTFQRVRAGFGNLRGFGAYNLQMRAHVIPADPKTPAQLQRRAIMALAVAAWKAAAPEVKALFVPAAKARNITPYMAFVSQYLKSYVPTSESIWDGGASTWDSGATQWDQAGPVSWDAGGSTWDSGATDWIE